ncbi:hypothetical protein NEOKW01_1992 [Nematocida sp. AWRm80]|nr:hypothetical protein NEOKW01_1992 [Nematocida sp. AWRm80]
MSILSTLEKIANYTDIESLYTDLSVVYSNINDRHILSNVNILINLLYQNISMSMKYIVMNVLNRVFVSIEDISKVEYIREIDNKYIFILSEILKEELNANNGHITIYSSDNRTIDKVDNIAVVHVYNILRYCSGEHKRTIIGNMYDMGIFILINLYSDVFLLYIYNSVFRNCLDYSYILGDSKENESGILMGTKDRMLLEDSTFGIRKLSGRNILYTPEQYKIEVDNQLYHKIIEIQDEYAIYYNILYNNNEHIAVYGNSDLNAKEKKEKIKHNRTIVGSLSDISTGNDISWTLYWYMLNIYKHINNSFYKQELDYIVSSEYYSKYISISTSIISILNNNLYLNILDSYNCTTVHINYNYITSLIDLLSDKNIVYGIYVINTISIYIKYNRRVIEYINQPKNTNNIVKQLEIAPETHTVPYISNIFKVLSNIDLTNMVLYRPSNIVLIVTGIEYIYLCKNQIESNTKNWIESYLRHLYRIYSTTDNSFASMLYTKVK